MVFICLDVVFKNLSISPSKESKCSTQLRPMSDKNVCKSWTFSLVLVEVLVLNAMEEVWKSLLDKPMVAGLAKVMAGMAL